MLFPTSKGSSCSQNAMRLHIGLQAIQVGWVKQTVLLVGLRSLGRACHATEYRARVAWFRAPPVSCDLDPPYHWIGSAVQTSSLTGQGIESLRNELRGKVLCRGIGRGRSGRRHGESVAASRSGWPANVSIAPAFQPRADQEELAAAGTPRRPGGTRRGGRSRLYGRRP